MESLFSGRSSDRQVQNNDTSTPTLLHDLFRIYTEKSVDSVCVLSVWFYAKLV